MDANEIKMKILESSGWTVKEITDAAAALVKEFGVMYTNDELAYRTIARELGISVEEEREYSAGQKDNVPTPLVKLEEAKNDLDDGEYFSTYFVVLAPFRAPKDTVGFLPVADESMQIDLKFWADDFDKGRMFKEGKTYKVDGIQGSYNDQYGWGISFAKYTKFEEVDEEIKPPITKIGVLEDGWNTFIIHGVVDEVKPIGIDLSFCETCGQYAGTSYQLEEAETDFFCQRCQEVKDTIEARPISGKIMDDSGTISFGLPLRYTKSPVEDGDSITIAGGYSSKKNRMYVKSVLSFTGGHQVSGVLDSFLKKKPKRSKKRSGGSPKNKYKAVTGTNIEKAVEHYKLNKETNWCKEMSVPKDVLDQFAVFGITSNEHVAELMQVLLEKGYAFMPNPYILKVVD